MRTRHLVGVARLICLAALLALSTVPLYAQGTYVYTNNDVYGSNTVSAFSVDANGVLTEIPGSPFATGGSGIGGGFFASVRATVCPIGNFLYISNSSSSDVSAFSIDPTTGALTAVPGSPFPTGGAGGIGISLGATLDGQFLIAANDGSYDISVFRKNLDGSLVPVAGSPFPAGGEPDGIKVTPDGRFLAVAVITGVAMFSIGPDGSLTPVPNSPFVGNGSTTGVDISCTSDRLFGGDSNFDHTIVDVFNLAADGTLAHITGSPFNFYPPDAGANSNVPLLSPDDQILFVSNQFSNSVTVFTVAADGSLTVVAGSPFAVGGNAFFTSGMATNLEGTFLFTANFDNLVGVFSIAADGTLTSVPGSPFSTGQPPGLLSLTVYPAKNCSPLLLSTRNIDFGDQRVGVASNPQTVTITNRGTNVINISSFGTTPGSDFTETHTCAASLDPGASCSADITFTPSARHERSDDLTIVSDARGSPHTVHLVGNGIAPELNLSATSLSFGDQLVGTSSPTQVIVLESRGDLPVNFTSIALTAGASDYSMLNNCPASLPPHEDNNSVCTVSTQFTPTAAGSRPGELTITTDEPQSPHVIPLSGNGIGPTFTPSLTSLSFGTQRVGTSSAPQTVVISNSGNAALTISNISMSGDFTQTNNCVGSVAAGGSCNLDVSFSPTVPGNINGLILISDNAPGSPHVITQSGTGLGPQATLSTTSVTFPGNPINLDCPGRTVTLANTGNDTLHISSVVPSSSVFTVTNGCGSSVAPGVSCDINIRFYSPDVGTVSGTVAINDDAPGSPQVINITATATPICLVIASAQQMTIVRGSDLATFGISDQNPSCSPVPLELSCTIDSPASCEFNPSTIPPTGSSTLRVKGLSRVQADFFNFIANKRAEFRTASVALSVLFSDFAFSTASSSASVAAGGSASYALTVRPTNGLNGRVSLACGGAPRGATCTVSPGAVMLDGANLAHLTVNVSTTSRSSAGPGTGPRPSPPAWWRLGPSADGFLWLLALAVLASLALARRRRAGLVLGVTLLLVLAWAACGGGGSMSSGNFGTPAGTYSLTVTGTYTSAAGDLSRSQSLSLTVN